MEVTFRWIGRHKKRRVLPDVKAQVGHLPLLGTTKRLIKIKFSRDPIASHAHGSEHCTKAPRRAISVRTQEHHQALQEARIRQKGAKFQEKYRSRAGIEGTIAQGVRAFGLRCSRYRGMEKTHFQDLAIATAINLVRVLAWLDGEPLAKTRTSKFAALALVA